MHRANVAIFIPIFFSLSRKFTFFVHIKKQKSQLNRMSEKENVHNIIYTLALSSII